MSAEKVFIMQSHPLVTSEVNNDNLQRLGKGVQLIVLELIRLALLIERVYRKNRS